MIGLPEGRLLAVRLAPGPRWLEVIDEAADAGAALLPIDHHLPPPEVQQILARARPGALLDDDGITRLDEGVPVEPGVGLVVASSGSSGEPRAVCLPWAAVDAAVRASIARLGATPGDEWLSCLPLSHMGGLLVLLRARSLGAPLRFGSFGPGAAYASIVPTQLARALEAEMDLSSYRALLVGGAALDPAPTARAPVVKTYGLTESCGGVVYDGRPLDGVLVRIGDEDEIQLRGPTLMRGYRLDEAATAASFTSDGWLRTRDAGTLDEGRLVVHGRLDEAINTGGEKVWPEEVERALRAHPHVADVAVAGAADPEWGERVVAYVVPAGESPALDDLRAFCADRLARHKAPRALVLLDELPRTPLGKVARARLPDTSIVDPPEPRR